MKKFYQLGRVSVVALVVLFATRVNAADLTFGASQGAREASVSFEVSGSDLIVTLTNTATADALVPVDILTAVFFDVTGGSLSLTRTSAIVPAGSFVHNGMTDPGNVVGGEWAYLSGLAGAPEGTSYGISSVGLGLFGPGDRFPGTDLEPPTSPDGLQYGITSAGDNLGTGNMPLMTNPLIKNAVVFTLSGLPMGFDPMTQIENIQFQYGTDLSEPHFPEPASAILMGIAAVGLLRRRR